MLNGDRYGSHDLLLIRLGICVDIIAIDNLIALISTIRYTEIAKEYATMGAVV